MISHRVAIFASLLAVLACRDEPPARASLDTATRGLSVADSLYYLDAKQQCGFLRQHLNPDPVALVAEYVRRDHEGQFLQTNSWLDTAYDCPGHLPGPDAFTAVLESRIVTTLLTDSIARVLVQSTVLGDMGQDTVGFTFSPRRVLTTDTFVVARTPFGWRIRSPQLPDNVLASWVLAHPERIHLRSGARDSVARLLRVRVP